MKTLNTLFTIVILLFSFASSASADASYKHTYPLSSKRMTVDFDKIYTIANSQSYRDFAQVGIKMDFKVNTKGVVQVIAVNPYKPFEMPPVHVSFYSSKISSNYSGYVDYEATIGVYNVGFGDNPRVAANIKVISIDSKKKQAVVELNGALFHNGWGVI